jgi:hypothetical protein
MGVLSPFFSTFIGLAVVVCLGTNSPPYWGHLLL